jgi:outer membrane receptor protein involved in Fe transport
MKKLIILMLLLTPLFSIAQTSIKGKVIDVQGYPLDAVTITLTQQGKNISTALTEHGHFTVTGVSPGNYILAASLIGYQSLSRGLVLPKDTLILVLRPEAEQLMEVVVTASKPVIQRKIDRITFNVENSIIASGGTAWDALSKAPGVQINSSNAVSANRKNVQVYLDGKPLNLSGDDLAGYLQGMPSNTVSQIEVFSNPPARFEAAGASVINIITKKTSNEGFNATLNSALTQGLYSSHSSSATFNYRKDKINVYGNYGYGRRHRYLDREYYVDYGSSYWESSNRIVSNYGSHNYRLGVDYQLTPNQVLGFLVTGNNRDGGSEGNTPTKIISNNKTVLDSTLQTVANSQTRTNQYAFNLNYNLKLDSGKHILNIDVDYSPYRNQDNPYVDNQAFLPDGTMTPNQYQIYTPTLQNIDIYSAKADYNYTIGKIWQVTSGLKYTRIQSINNFDFYNNLDELILVPANGNDFDYTENIAAIYTSASGSIGQLNLQGGLRLEQTQTKGYSQTLNTTNKRSYLKLFPTLFLQYKLDDNNELQLNYGHRIERPDFGLLNPARRYTSPYNYYTGNPALQPAYIQNVELGYTYKKQYNVTAYYTEIHDVITNVNQQDNNSKMYYGTQANLGLAAMTGVRFSAPIHVADWWEANAIFDTYVQHEKSEYLDRAYNYHKWSYAATLNQSFTIKKNAGLKGEILAVFNGPNIQNVYQGKHNSEVDAALKTNVLGGAGTIRLGVNDIFNTNSYDISIRYYEQNSGFFHHNESRNFTLGFAYRLGSNVAAQRSRSTASEEERKRAQ